MTSRLSIRNYQILGRISSGGQGVVYRAWDSARGRMVAVKELGIGFLPRPEVIERFRREAIITNRVNHPNVIEILEQFEYNGRHFIVMELLSASVHDIRKRERALPISWAVDKFRQVAAGLEAAHQCNVVHRDIKPQNLLLSSDGKIKVTYFGLARASDLTTITEGGQPGTVVYISPEQLVGEDLDIRSDIYSLGVTMYELLTGSLPFKGRSQYEIAVARLRQAPILISRIRPEVHPKLAEIIDRCMEREPDKRFQTPSQVTAELRDPHMRDWAALVALYDATDGDNWTHNENWITDTAVGNWHGITIDNNGRVTGIKLSANGLNGQLPRELGNLSNLASLQISRSPNLTGEIPAELGKLSSLVELDLSKTSLSGAIPNELGSLSNLTSLVIRDSCIKGQIPSEIGNLNGLMRLDLSDNDLSDEIPAELGNLTNLMEPAKFDGNSQLRDTYPKVRDQRRPRGRRSRRR